ncbi:MAG TPA: TetR family transcriptional regulator [Acidimicrobiales bacterium]
MTARPRATARGARTRDRILDTAERLWGERGVEGVSLREIRIGAGQRNSSALQFHFGGRDGLLQALAERHLPRVAGIQERLYAEAVADGRRDDIAALVEVLVRPTADYLRLGPSPRAWVMVCADLASRPDVAVADVIGHAPAVALHVGTAVHEHLAATMGGPLATERIMAVTTAAHHLCADRARAEDAAAPAAGLVRPLLPFEVWRANLLDMAVAAMTAPVRGRSPVTSRPGRPPSP